MKNEVIVFAPNIHCGGGAVVLQALLNGWPRGRLLRAFLDNRASHLLVLPPLAEIIWVKPTITARFRAELMLSRMATDKDTIVFLHSLPPLLPVLGTIVVFHQNRILLGIDPIPKFSFRVTLRITVEKLWSRFLCKRVDRYVVQTPTMSFHLDEWLKKISKTTFAKIKIIPFADLSTIPIVSQNPEWDFVYVANGAPHKNHATLFAAWRHLAKQGHYPTLAVTIGRNDRVVRELLASLHEDGLSHIVNLEQLPHEEILKLYQRARAVIFPSLTESFGLPLIEATHCGLPVVASELDFVRDVCQPVQTFDPKSPLSIARAVRRFMFGADNPVEIRSPIEFWDNLLDNSKR